MTRLAILAILATVLLLAACTAPRSAALPVSPPDARPSGVPQYVSGPVASHPADAGVGVPRGGTPPDPTADPRAALAGHPSPDRGSGPWVLRLVCCGYDDGIERYATWDEADMFRQTYVTGPGGHDRAAILTRDLDTTYLLDLLGIER